MLNKVELKINSKTSDKQLDDLICMSLRAPERCVAICPKRSLRGQSPWQFIVVEVLFDCGYRNANPYRCIRVN